MPVYSNTRHEGRAPIQSRSSAGGRGRPGSPGVRGGGPAVSPRPRARYGQGEPTIRIYAPFRDDLTNPPRGYALSLPMHPSILPAFAVVFVIALTAMPIQLAANGSLGTPGAPVSPTPIGGIVHAF